jgi:hypothetical protein
MNKNLLILLLLLVVVGAVLWYCGRENGRQMAMQEATLARVDDIESRLLPLEKDFQQRKAIRGKITTVFSWVRGWIGF